MFNLISNGLAVQKLICDANHVTDAEAQEIKSHGLRLVHRPDNLTSISEAQAMRAFRSLVSPDEAA